MSSRREHSLERSFGLSLGWLSTRILLSLVFFVLVTPLRVMWRMSGYDPLDRRRRTFRGWSEYPKRYHDPDQCERMLCTPAGCRSAKIPSSVSTDRISSTRVELLPRAYRCRHRPSR